MQLSNSPAKFPLAFAASGSKNTIPVASQVGITPGAASLTDGFPPLTRTAISAGGVPPSGLDMNGILYKMSASLRWANAGGGYAYDGTFATDANVNGYPKGARVMRADAAGYWLSTVENNTTDPDAGGAGWVPDYTGGASLITMTNANVTLTAPEYGKQIIVITGTLSANLNLIFPAIPSDWSIINNTSGAYSITAKTASGTGVVLGAVTQVIGDGTDIYTQTSGAVVDASTSVKGKVQLATAAEVATGTDTLKAVTPATFLSSKGAAKAWVNINGTTGAIRASFNVSSVTRNGVGDYTITFTNAMSDANYTLGGSAAQYIVTPCIVLCPAANAGGLLLKTTSAIRIYSWDNSTDALYDANEINAIILGN